jgi:hypothetical protein
MTSTRPIGVAAGGLGLLLAWAGGLAIARLTGATPVVIVLAAAAVWFVAAVVAGWRAVAAVEVCRVVFPPAVTVGEEVSVVCEVSAGRPVWVELRSGGRLVAEGWSDGGVLRGAGSFDVRGSVRSLEVRLRSAGVLGLVWWRRRVEVEVDEVLVAPAAQLGGVPVQRSSVASDGDRAGRTGAVAGETDGIRPWREGDSEKYVHWASTMRTGELVVHDRRQDADLRWVVRPRVGTADPDAEAGAARAALEQGLRAGAHVSVAVGDGEPVRIADTSSAARWAAVVDLGPRLARPRRRRERWNVEPVSTARASARWWSAAATIVSLVMLTTALGYSPLVTTLVVGSIVLGAAVSAPLLASGAPTPAYVRVLVGVGALLAFLAVAASAGRLSGLLGLLRGPLPQILVILIALHGFECRDRRTVRVGLAISAVVLMYASGFRVDDSIVWWLLVWGACFAAANAALGGPPTVERRPVDLGHVLRTGGSLTAGAVATVALLALVPVPTGPARLTLPTFIDDADPVGRPGAVAGPDGDVRDDATGDDARAPAGQAGGYNGFAQTMDTSVRGELSDEVVMRVRAPEPDFWRGQTFADFDGRRWHADDEIGSQRSGPDIDIPPTIGDTQADDVPVERFVQTFYAEHDLPNVVFGAYRATQVIIDADVWTRSDGAIRASTILPAGSVYTVVSNRVQVTEELLRRQGRIDQRLSALGREVLGQYLAVPPSTTDETIALATELAEGHATTYDLVRAYESWIGANVVYDLDAPVPDPGEDAVHDFLFDSRRGFCEQIASALTIMLRTQGVPARLAVGYTSGTRDRVAGVFEVRGSDAHAWVEVWFPDTGWQPFDPTASVPLSGEAEASSVGGELLAGAGATVRERPGAVAAVLALLAAGVAGSRLALRWWWRRRRGRWGVLQDRFAELALERGAGSAATNPARAAEWGTSDLAGTAASVAASLDRVVFDPSFDVADDEAFRDAERHVRALAREPAAPLVRAGREPRFPR